MIRRLRVRPGLVLSMSRCATCGPGMDTGSVRPNRKLERVAPVPAIARLDLALNGRRSNWIFNRL